MKNNFVVLKQSLIVFIFCLCLSDYRVIQSLMTILASRGIL